MKALNLRIKKKYFDLIASGEKTSEFRSDSDYYKGRLENRDWKQIILHYQRDARLLCEIISIKLVDTPDYLDRKIITTKKCWEIKLKKPKLFFKSPIADDRGK